MAPSTKEKAVSRLRKVLNRIPELKGLPNYSPEFEKWRRNVQMTIANTFGDESGHVEDFKKVRYTSIVFT